MKAATLPIVPVLALGGCRGARRAPAPASVMRSRTDTADVLEAVWRVPVRADTGGGVRWLYLPGADSGADSAADSAAATVSDAVRAALASRCLPVSARRPAGDDTVVYRIDRWTRDAAGHPVLSVSSRWTRMSTGTPSICMLAGNAKTCRGRRTQDGWKAERTAPGTHGVGYCESNGRRP